MLLEPLIRASTLEPGESYNLACVMALTGRPDDARAFLHECWRYGTLPSSEHLIADPDLASIRALPWFAEILALARGEP